METFDYVVTCRFHGVVLAHILNKPILAISHHPKVANLMEELSMEQYCVDIQTYNPGDLKNRFKALTDHEQEVQQSLAASLVVNRLKVASQFDQLFSSVDVKVSKGLTDAMLEATITGHGVT
jgi:polysaccharide pyruvyl transferase WcaK-like protein